MPQRRSAVPRVFVALLTLALTMFAASPGHARSPEKNFPEFAGQKGSLGAVAILTDAVVIEDVIGSTDKIYLTDCKQIATQVLETFASEMTAKGYKIQARAALSMGVLCDTTKSYRILPSWAQHKMDGNMFPVQAAPFYVDTAMVRGEEGLAAWSSVARGVFGFQIKKDKPAEVLSGITTLSDVLGADHAFVVLVTGTKIPFGKQFGQGMLSSYTKGGAPVGAGFSVSAGVDFTQYSGTTIRVAMIDCHSGAVLWSDGDEEKKSVNADQVDGLAKNVLKRLP